MKKILLVDDSTLMRRVICDIINADERFHVTDEALNGLDALELLKSNTYDAVVLDVNMPKMDGLTLLKELRRQNIMPKVLMASTTTMDGAKNTIEALELGALDFVHKPEWSYHCREEEFKKGFLTALDTVCRARIFIPVTPAVTEKQETVLHSMEKILKNHKQPSGRKIVAIASSTGGPKALQSVLPLLPKNLNAPVVLVQHMPEGFTASLAQRLNTLSQLTVVEAKEGEELQDGTAYLAKSGQHMNLIKKGSSTQVHYLDGPTREGVRPCANFMYESLADSNYDEVICVVMTGMGADGTEGILHLKEKKKAYVMTQDGETCVVNGMPKSAVRAGVSNQVVPLLNIAQEIILHVGVK